MTKYKQWKDRITSKQLACEFGMEEPLEDLVMEYRQRWLGHLGRMGEERLPKMLLFAVLDRRDCAMGPRRGGVIE